MHQTKAYEPGDTILSQGETSRGFCILKSGTLEVVKSGKVITELSVPGQFFGEMSDILGEPRTSDVRAKDEALVIHIDLAVEQFRGRSVADRDENAIDGQLPNLIALSMAEACAGHTGRILLAQDFFQLVRVG